ncbi:hypothetical protein Q644_01890 [Brucella intermedia 229E]|uniref:Uncharacterized protein n=1 Tax=Brucella intermedia 229E TaxID=1337887 RepID=U4VEL8_9HYPH|nr:hypothetical protein Q644_01890 [Brucella intermedia 229E]
MIEIKRISINSVYSAENMSLHRFVFREGTLSVGKTHFIGQLKRSSRFFMASVAATAICIATPSIVQANDWTGAVSDDFFDPPFNWDDNNGPQVLVRQ